MSRQSGDAKRSLPTTHKYQATNCWWVNLGTSSVFRDKAFYMKFSSVDDLNPFLRRCWWSPSTSQKGQRLDYPMSIERWENVYRPQNWWGSFVLCSRWWQDDGDSVYKSGLKKCFVVSHEVTKTSLIQDATVKGGANANRSMWKILSWSWASKKHIVTHMVSNLLARIGDFFCSQELRGVLISIWKSYGCPLPASSIEFIL
jgi:hypothetical protein